MVGITGEKSVTQQRQAHQLGLPILSSFDKDVTLYEDVPRHTDIIDNNGTSRACALRPTSLCTNGSLVILGMVGLGAEVIADDSIHIYGACADAPLQA